jgi:NADH-quinone oxidoreductase subunit G
VADYLSGAGLVELLAGVAVAAAEGGSIPDSIAKICKGVSATDADRRIAASLKASDDSLVLLGTIAGRHAAYSAVRALSAAIASLTGAKIGNVTSGPNSAGASLAGVLPHRVAGGRKRDKIGKGVSAILEGTQDAVLLVNVEPDADIHATTDVVRKLARQKYVIVLTPFVSDALLEAADLLLPIGTFAETSGTYVNVAGTWQSFGGVAKPVGDSRPCWKVLRVLGNLLNADGFDYVTSEDVLAECKTALGDADQGDYKARGAFGKPNGEDAPADEIDTPLYSQDSLVRRANALQKTLSAKRAAGSK